jgi:hypothetical protein
VDKLREKVRGYHSKHLQKRKVYWIQYYRNGKPYRETTKSQKEADAKRLLKKREGEISQGKLPGIYFDRYNIVNDRDLQLAAQRQAVYLGSQTDTISNTIHDFKQKEANPNVG